MFPVWGVFGCSLLVLGEGKVQRNVLMANVEDEASCIGAELHLLDASMHHCRHFQQASRCWNLKR